MTLNTKKQFLVLVLCLCSLASLAEVGDTISAVAPSGQKLYYKITSHTTVEVVPPKGLSWAGFTKPTGSLTIPSSVTNDGTPYSVTAIGNNAFALCFSLTSVSIPTSVTSIGNYAFQYCSSLTSVSIPTSVISIGEGAFQNCSALSYITIPASVANIESRAFQDCPSLATMTVDGSNTHYDSRGNCNAIIETATNTLIAGTMNTVIPNSVTTIGDYSFCGCSGLTTLTIPKLVTSIGNYAFSGCSGLTSVTIPNSVTSIGNDAFRDCSSLTSVTIPNSVTSIGNYAFSGCSGLTSVTIPYSVTSIGNYAFSGCSGLTNVTIVGGVTSIGERAFANCSQLTHLIVPSSVSLIGSNAFEGIDTVYFRIKINIPGSPWGAGMVITTDYRVDGDPLVYESPYKTMVVGYNSTATNVTIPNSVISIENDAFYNCRDLTSVTIPNSVTNIGAKAFHLCWGLTGSLTIPNSVIRIGNGAFYDCSGLTSVTIGESVTTIEHDAFRGCPNVVTLHYNAKNLKTTSEWCSNQYYGFRPMGIQNLVIGDSVKTLPAGVFYGLDDLTSVTIGESVTSIENHAFEGCTNVETLYYNAQNLTTSSDWSTNSTLGFRPMRLQNIVVGEGVESLPDYVFYSQNFLTSVTLPSTLTSIGEKSFYESIFSSIDIPSGVSSIGKEAFMGCFNLSSISIPKGVTNIEEGTFNGCRNLASIVIKSSIDNIGTNAFAGCSNLKTVYNLSNLSITKGADTYGYVAKNALRVLSKNNGFSDYGTGSNTLHQISTDYTVVDAEDDNVTRIPRSTIPTNFIYYDNGAKDGSGWKANEIFLTDDTNRFVAPVAFTAEKATYSREFTNSNRSTLYLPFTAAVPEGFDVYDFAGFDGHTLTFSNHEGNIVAYTPYLVGYDLSKDGNTTQCTITQENVAFPASSSAAAPTPINGMTFQGTTQRTCMTSSNYGYSNGYFVQSDNGTNHSGHAHVNPFRCYFTYSASDPMGIPPTLDIDLTNNGLTGIETPDKPVRQNNIRYSDDVFDTMGRLVRKHAKDLEGLPRGIYIWKGKKVLHFND